MRQQGNLSRPIYYYQSPIFGAFCLKLLQFSVTLTLGLVVCDDRHVRGMWIWAGVGFGSSSEDNVDMSRGEEMLFMAS